MPQEKLTTYKSSEEEDVDLLPKRDEEASEKLDADVEDILNDIDSVLEENAEEFVKGYVQKGGQ